MRGKAIKLCFLTDWDFSQHFQFHKTRQESPKLKTISTPSNTFGHSYQHLEWFLLITIFSNVPHKTTIINKLTNLHLSTCMRQLYSYTIVHMAPSLIVSLSTATLHKHQLSHDPPALQYHPVNLLPQETEIIRKKLNFLSFPIQIPNSLGPPLQGP